MENREQLSAGILPANATPMVENDRSYVDWAAIFGGAAVAVAIGVLATGFGAALGLTAVSARSGAGSGKLGIIISIVWIVLSMVSAYAAGGYIAGRMRRRADRATKDEVTVRDGMNGLIVWGLGIVVSAMLLGSAIGTTLKAVGNVASAARNAVAQVAGGVASGAVSAAAGLVPDGLKNDPMAFVTSSMLRPAAVQPGADVSATDAAAILGNLASTGVISDPDRTYLVQLTTARTGLTEADAKARVDAAVTATQSARDKAVAAAADAEKIARDTVEAARISAILTAFLLTAMSLVSGVAAYIAAVKGGRHRDDGRIFGGFAYHK